MFDYFDVLGVSPAAGWKAIRQAEHRRSRVPHPDFGASAAGPSAAAGRGVSDAALSRALSDVAVDFLDVRTLVGRMQRSLFGPER